MRKHIEIGIGRDYISIEQIPTRWWLVDRALQAFCSLTRCRFCGRWPWWELLNYSINRPSRTRFEIPMADEPKRALAEWLRITTCEADWADEDEDEVTA